MAVWTGASGSSLARPRTDGGGPEYRGKGVTASSTSARRESWASRAATLVLAIGTICRVREVSGEFTAARAK
jgi:hypothetical protein